MPSFCVVLMQLSHRAYTFCRCTRKTFNRQRTCLDITEGLCFHVLQLYSSTQTRCTTGEKKAGIQSNDVDLPAGPSITLSVQVSKLWPCVLGNDVAFIICKKQPDTQKSHALHRAQVSAICQA